MPPARHAHRILGLHRRRLASSGKGLPSATSYSAAFGHGRGLGPGGLRGDAGGSHGAPGTTGRAYEDQLMNEMPPFSSCACGVRQ